MSLQINKTQTMKILHLTLKKQWFDMIVSGEKKEEYREIKPYWEKRLADVLPLVYLWKPFDIVQAYNGGSPSVKYPNIKWQHKGIRIGEGKPEWGAVPGVKYFILEIGDIISPAE